jgi:hypothetical protein
MVSVEGTLSPLTAEILRIHVRLENNFSMAPGHPEQNVPGYEPERIRAAYLELLETGLLTKVCQVLYRTNGQS